MRFALFGRTVVLLPRATPWQRRQPTARGGVARRVPAAALGTIMAAGLLVLAGADAASAYPIAPGAAVGPTLVSPADGVVVSEAPLLTWSPGPRLVEYMVDVSSTPDFALGTVRWGAGTRGTQHVPANVGPGTYWWRVRGVTLSSQVAPWSAVRSFTVLPALVDAPALLAPANGAAFAYPDGETPLRWTPVPGATGYEVELADDAGFTANTRRTRVMQPATMPPLDTMGRPVHWRVRTLRGWDLSEHNTVEVGPWSTGRMYTMTWDAVPAPVSPPDGAVVTSLYAAWDPVPGAQHYDVQVTTAEDPTFAAATDLSAGEPFRLLPVASGVPVLWRVRARTGWGQADPATGWSAPRSATVDPTGETLPVPQSLILPPVEPAGPADEVTLTSSSDAVLGWVGIPGAVGYQLQLCEDGLDFDITSPTAGQPDTHTVLTGAGGYLPAGSTYKWRVRAVGGDGTGGPWSEVRRLHIAPGSGPDLVAPSSDGTVPAAAAVLAWGSTPSRAPYDLQLSRTPDFSNPQGPYSILGSRHAVSIDTGRWYWRVFARGYPATTVSATGTFTVVDTTPPVGVLDLNGTQSFVAAETTSISVATEHEDIFGSVAAVRLSQDGVSWTRYASSPWNLSTTLPITTPEAGGTTPGRRDVWAAWEDDSGNVSTPVRASVWYAMQPPDPPGAPTGVAGTPGNSRVTVSWSAPASDGGAAITGYTVTVSPGSTGCTSTGGLACVVDGLTNGTPYTFRVYATSDAGIGTASAESAAVTPRTVPGPPRAVTAVPGNASAVVTWSAPVDNGGSPITGYSIVSSPAGAACAPAPATATSCTATGLANGVAYGFTVRAINAAGTGPASAGSTAVTPSAPVAPPAGITALPVYSTTTSLQVTWSGTAGSSPVATYDVRYRRAPWYGTFGPYTDWLKATTSTARAFGLWKGSTYCFSARARDTAGRLSAWTAETCTAVPLDDRSLVRTSSWSARTGSAYYAGTALNTFTYGARLTRTSVVARRIALVATTCHGCGTVRVYWNGALLRTISLESATTMNRRVISVVTFSTGRRGTLVVRVVSSSKRVIIDGVAIRRV